MIKKTSKNRQLVYYSIIHTQEDLGTFSKVAEGITIERVGKQGLKYKLDQVNRVWKAISTSLEKLTLNYSKTRIYQDGLPFCGYETSIVTDLAKKGSINHQLILLLVAKGALLMGTEDPNLLMEEYRITQLLFNQYKISSEKEKEKLLLDSQSVLEKRDIYIASQINETLQQGETGILFIGALHSLTNYLQKDIQVIIPIKQHNYH